jgi:hypothetical protein
VAVDNIEVIAALRDLISRPAGRATHALHQMENRLESLRREYESGAIAQEAYIRELRKMSRTARLAGHDSARFRRELAKHEQQIGSSNRRGLRGMLSRLSTAFSDVGEAGSKLGKQWASLKLPMMGVGIAALIPLITALGGGLMALVGHFGPAIGVVGAFPGVLLAGVSAMGIFKTALSGMSEGVAMLNDPNSTLADINKFFADKTPEYKAFAVALADLHPQFKKLKEGMLTTQASKLAHNIGLVVRYFTNMFTSSQALDQMSQIFTANRELVVKIGTALVHVFDIFRGFMVAAIPMTHRLADAFRGMMARWDTWVNSGPGQRTLLNFFNTAADRAFQLWHIFRDLAIALWNIASAGKGLGNVMGGGLERGMASFRAWTESDKGQKKMAEFYGYIKQTLDALGRFGAKFAEVFLQVGANGGNQNMVAGFIDSLTGALPAIKSILDGLIKVVPVVTAIIKAISWIGPEVLIVFWAVYKVLRIFLAFKKLITELRLAFALAGFGPAGWIALAVIALGVAFYELWKHSETFRNLVKDIGRLGAHIWDEFLKGLHQMIDGVKDLINWLSKVHLPGHNKDGSKATLGGRLSDWAHNPFGWAEGGPVLAGQHGRVGEVGRELFIGSSGKAEMLVNGYKHFSEPGVVVPNPVTEAILAGAVAAPQGGSSTASAEGTYLRDLALPPISVDARGMSREEAIEVVHEAIRKSRQSDEARYGRKP